MDQALHLAKTSHRYKLPASAEMVSFDQQTISTGIPGIELMERAGKGVCSTLDALGYFPLDRQVTVLVGPGNNGGDGLVVARELQQRGVQVTAILAGAPRYSPDLICQLSKYILSDGSLLFWPGDKGFSPPLELQFASQESILSVIADSALVIDALLGTGQVSTPRDAVKDLVCYCCDVNRSASGNILIAAVDMPTGINADNGAVFAHHLKADLTVAIELVKRGMLQYPARYICGRIETVDIGIDCSGFCEFEILSKETVTCLPARYPAAHKGNFGHVLVVAGSRCMPGAAHLAAMAALRSGAGLVTKTVLKSVVEGFSAPELLLCPVEDQTGYYEVGHLSQMLPALKTATCVVLGPGLGQADPTIDFVRELIAVARDSNLSLVIDADALNCLAGLVDRGYKIDLQEAVVTPHPGEAGKLLGVSTAEVQQDRYRAAKELAVSTKAMVVLKGAATVIYVGKRGLVYPTANPYLATAGSGDVLTGIIAALISQGLTREQAVCLGVFAHGVSGSRASQKTGGAIIASDFLDNIPGVLTECTIPEKLKKQMD